MFTRIYHEINLWYAFNLYCFWHTCCSYWRYSKHKWIVRTGFMTEIWKTNEEVHWYWRVHRLWFRELRNRILSSSPGPITVHLWGILDIVCISLWWRNGKCLPLRSAFPLIIHRKIYQRMCVYICIVLYFLLPNHCCRTRKRESCSRSAIQDVFASQEILSLNYLASLQATAAK